MPSIIKVDQIQSDTGNVAISGNVSSTLRVSNTSFPLIVRSGGTNHITMFDTRSSTGVGTMIGTNQDGNTYYDSNYNATATTGGHIWRSGGSDILTLGATGLLTTTAGIKFPASQNASSDANTLDDYEEGTWTPSLFAAIGTVTSYSSSGAYTKVGNLVTVQAKITITNIGSASSTMYFGNLPFSPKNLNRPSVFLVRENASTGETYQGLTLDSGTTGVIATLTTNGSAAWINNYEYTFCMTYMSN